MSLFDIELYNYIHKNLQEYLERQQADNLPKLEGFGCFIVKGVDIEDLVLIGSKQNILSSYPYTLEGYMNIEAKINMIKILKHMENE